VRSARILALILVIALPCGVAIWTLSVRSSWGANQEFAAALLASASSDTALYREFLPAEQLAQLASQRRLLTGEPRRVLADETCGAFEFGYCLATGAYAYVTFLKDTDPPKPANLIVYAPGTPRSQICASP
jgi:hypothetical protein